MRYIIKNNLIRIIYLLFKIFFSYITFILLKFKTTKFLESIIVDVLFQDKYNRNENKFLSAFLYLHQIMLKINEKNEIKSKLRVVNFLNNHINKCNKAVCNCNLLKSIMNNFNTKKNNTHQLKFYLEKLKNILNYFFESSFIELDYSNKYNLVVLLAEHFCFLRNNPIMAFSLIKTLINKKKNNFSKIQMIILYELGQKYIYYLKAKEIHEIELDTKKNKKDSLLYKIRSDELMNYYIYLRMSCQAKKLIMKYIDNQIKILKYRIIFEDSLSYKYEENTENIISVKIVFFEQSTKIDNLYDNSNEIKNELKNSKNSTNLHFIVYLLKKEHLYHSQIINNIGRMEKEQNMPIFIIFKLFIFFDIFGGGKMPEEIPTKFYNSFSNINNIYNNYITSNEYSILIKRYKEQNNRINSKYYAIFKYKNELRTKYYSEISALKLGYRQKDLINKKIDELMPKEFSNSHQNIVKKLIVGSQIRTFNFDKNYFFDITSTQLFSVNYNGALIYSISKSLNIIFQWAFNIENEYHFMMNSNFDLIAISKNFESEYFLNQKIFKTYNLKLLEILKIKPEVIYEKFNEVISNIKYQKYIRQVITEEYFIPHLYVPNGEKNIGIMNSSAFNISKNNILTKLSNYSNNDEKNIKSNIESDINEKEEDNQKLIKKNNLIESINDLFINKGKSIFHSNFTTYINKLNFIKKLEKELSKVDDYQMNFEDEKDNYCYNLITTAKKLLSTLEKKMDLSYNYLKIEIRLSFYYDKIFYFLTIDDEQKYCLKLKKMVFENQQKEEDIKHSYTSSFISNKKTISFEKKSRNKKLSAPRMNPYEDKFKKGAEKKTSAEALRTFIKKIENKDIVMNKINEYKHKINRDKFIFIIRLILFIIIICILVIYIIIIIKSRVITNTNETILLSYFYNSHARDYMLDIHSKLLEIFYDHADLAKHPILNNKEYENTLYFYSNKLKDVYHNFTNYFYEYNLEINHELNLLYQKRKFYKIRGFWQEIEYESEYSSELDYIIYSVFALNMSNQFSPKAVIERKNFIFFKERTDTKEKCSYVLIKLLYYFMRNYEFAYKDIFELIEKTIYNSFVKFLNYHKIVHISLEGIATILFILFYVEVNTFLYYSNEVIIKNIIFLFLDFSEDFNNKNKGNNNKVSLKLLELQDLINDFDLNRFGKFSQNIDNINNNNYNYINQANKTLDNNNKNYKNEIRKTYKSLNLNKKISNKQLFSFENKLMVNKNSKKNNIKPKNLDSININSYNNTNNKKINNSSQNYLVETNANILRTKLSSNIRTTTKEILSNSNLNSNNSSKKIIMKIEKKSLKSNINEEQENLHDIILNESKKHKIFLIKIYSFLILFFMLITISFSILKFIYAFRFNRSFNNFFIDFTIISNRYNSLFYYFNTFRTLLISPEDDKKDYLFQIMENMTQHYQNENKKFNNIISSKMEEYKEIAKIIYTVKQSKEGVNDIIKDNICLEESICLNYLYSNYNSNDTGIDFTFQAFMVQLNNIFMEYKKLNNKTDINLINSTLINTKNSQFISIGVSLSHLFFFLKEKIFDSFIIDEIHFKNKYLNFLTFLNIISILSSLISFLFINIFIFISLYRFSKHLKKSTYRINCSFFNIKKYALPKYTL